MYSSNVSSLNNQYMHNSQTNVHLQMYESLNEEYCNNGFTYKANQILHKTAQENPKLCPYQLLLGVAKIYHMNQFETIFFTHILNEPSARKAYDHDNEGIFALENVKFPVEVERTIVEVYEELKEENGRGLAEKYLEENSYNNQENIEEGQITLDQVKKTYLYLLVIGYAIKYYLNEPNKAKPYEEYANRHIQNFIGGIFNKWARNHGNTALATTPRKINGYYMGLGFLEGEEEGNNEQQGEDCQYRNYNEIVEELIKATMQEGDSELQMAGEELDHE